MSEKPILFSGAMVRAILDGAKTQTRRLVKQQVGEVIDSVAWYPDYYEVHGDPGSEHQIPSPYAVGDTLWVKETWRLPDEVDHLSPSEFGARLASRSFAGNRRDIAPVRYEADNAVTPAWEPWCRAGACVSGKTRVSIHMPRWASRLTLRVTDVRVERLGDISDADVDAEGAVHWWRTVDGDPDLAPRYVWEHLWGHVHGDGAWERDRERWVWVYGFEVVR
jgi:hypothetical protein